MMVLGFGGWPCRLREVGQSCHILEVGRSDAFDRSPGENGAHDQVSPKSWVEYAYY